MPRHRLFAGGWSSHRSFRMAFATLRLSFCTFAFWIILELVFAMLSGVPTLKSQLEGLGGSLPGERVWLQHAPWHPCILQHGNCNLLELTSPLDMRKSHGGTWLISLYPRSVHCIEVGPCQSHQFPHPLCTSIGATALPMM